MYKYRKKYMLVKLDYKSRDGGQREVNEAPLSTTLSKLCYEVI